MTGQGVLKTEELLFFQNILKWILSHYVLCKITTILRDNRRQISIPLYLPQNHAMLCRPSLDNLEHQSLSAVFSSSATILTHHRWFTTAQLCQEGVKVWGISWISMVLNIKKRAILLNSCTMLPWSCEFVLFLVAYSGKNNSFSISSSRG
jgi:hypothetical protein